MKKILLSAMISSLVILAACNDQSSNSGSLNTDSASPNTTDNASMSKALIKNGLPLSSNQEVPANTSSASGTADVSYDKESHMLKFTVNWSGLTDKPTMAHIHGTAPRGTNAGVKQDLSGIIPKEVSGSFTDSVMVDGNSIKEDSLLSGFYYINIHTPLHPGGEIRGQIEF